MKKIIGLAVAAVMLFSGVANASVYRVDFAGLVGDGTFDGFFTYDDSGLNLDGINLNFAAGLESELELNYAYSGATGSFNETTAGVFSLEFAGGTLNKWGMGGNINGTGSTNLSLEDDFIMNTGDIFGGLRPANAALLDTFQDLEWGTIEVVEVSAVPLPAAVWMFGAGAVVLFGLRRRKKKETEALQTA